MNYLRLHDFDIFDQFDDIYFKLKFILLAISMDELSSILEQEPETPYSDSPITFELLN